MPDELPPHPMPGNKIIFRSAAVILEQTGFSITIRGSDSAERVFVKASEPVSGAVRPICLKDTGYAIKSEVNL